MQSHQRLSLRQLDVSAMSSLEDVNAQRLLWQRPCDKLMERLLCEYCVDDNGKRVWTVHKYVEGGTGWTVEFIVFAKNHCMCTNPGKTFDIRDL